jgi:hypothetical protein
MSSTSGIQNLLVNVFRPVYTYNAATTNAIFVPQLEMSNINTYSGNSISVFTAAVGDSASNVYVGSNSGNVYTNTQFSSNNTAVGYGAGSNISNVSNSSYFGFNAGAGAGGASNVIGIGANVGGAGISNIFIGNGTKSTGNGNILIGHGIDIGAGNNTLRLGSTVYGNLATNWIGIGTSSPSDINSRFDVSGNARVQGQMGINTTPTRTLDVNGDFRATDASLNALDFTGGVTRSSGGFASVRGSNLINPTGSIVIGTLKRGIINISTVDIATSANRSAFIVFDSDIGVTTPELLVSTTTGTLDITFNTSNIQISNSSGSTPITAAWSITYFPLP